jgi:PAS domain S-box-containing protein
MAEAGATVRVLVLEDLESDARLLDLQLRKSGLEFESNRVTSESAFLQALDGEIDVILADYGLPGVNVEHMLEAAKQLQPDTPFLIVSGSIRDELGVELMKRGADDYLLKDRLERLGQAVEHSLDRAHSRRQARASESRYVNLFEQLPVGVYRATAGGEVVDANPALLLITGFADLEAIRGVRVFDMCADLRDRAALLERLARDGIVTDFEALFTRADGVLSWMRSDVRAVLDDDGLCAGFDGLLIDIGERKRAEADVRQSLSELERMDDAKTNFLATVSHEFRTALFGIQGYSEMLSRRECAPAAVMQYAGNINHDVRRLGRLISDLLDLARMESGEEQLRIEEVDLSELITEAAGRAGAGTDRHDLKISVAAGLPRVLADRDRLAQVLANLLANAIKYSPAGGEIAITAGEHPEGVLVEVRDQGMGISADLIDGVFEPYRRSEAPGTRAIKGTGLGLPIVRHIVDLHGGRIWAESEEGAGSTLRFTLPLRAPESDSKGVPQTRGQPEAAAQRSTQIGR